MKTSCLLACLTLAQLIPATIGMSMSSALEDESNKKTGQAAVFGPERPVESSRPKVQFGIGWPDVRVRFNLWRAIDGEAKVAFEEGIQAYGGRLYAQTARLGALAVLLGVEGGWVHFDGIESLGGDGHYGQAFAGLQYTVSERWAVTADIGPAFMNVNAEGYSQQSQGWVYNTALYFRIF